MNEFQSWDSFETFSTSIRRTSRFCLNSEAHEFLETVRITSQQRELKISKGTIYWRARKGYALGHKPAPYDDLPVMLPHPEDGMKPLPESPSEGRCTPKGMPSCLYVSDDVKTAIAELRPSVGSYVSIAKVELLRDLSLVDCSSNASDDDYVYYEHELLPAERGPVVWAAIRRAFSIPVNPDDSTDYLPTQAIAEKLLIAGLDGVAYRSRLGKGLNLALFDVSMVRVGERTVHRIDCVDYRFHDVTEDGVPASEEYFTSRWQKAPNV